MSRLLIALATLLTVLPAVAAAPDANITVRADRWPEAEKLFHRDPQWLGADGAATVDLGQGRVLWLFSDSFVGNVPGANRRNATFVRNTVAIQSGYDPTTAEFRATWDDSGDAPRSFLPEEGENWFWPGDGELIDGQLVIFYIRLERSDRGLGFRTLDWRAVLVPNPHDPPSEWSFRKLKTPKSSFDVLVGFGSVTREGDFLHAYGPQKAPRHPLYVVRWPIAEVLAGDLSGPQWWSATEQAWKPHDELSALPAPIVDNGQAEFTVHWDERLRQALLFQTTFFPISPVAVRTAPQVVGPWSETVELHRPPEMATPRRGFQMYSAKAHPELDAGGRLAVTYCTNALPLGEVIADETLYYPRFLRVELSEPASP